VKFVEARKRPCGGALELIFDVGTRGRRSAIVRRGRALPQFPHHEDELGLSLGGGLDGHLVESAIDTLSVLRAATLLRDLESGGSR
jgi:hypothetical protein